MSGVGVTLRTSMAILLLTGIASAQSLQVYSEFRRVDPYGEILPQDRGGQPREILSPLVARNSHFTFRIVVEAPPGKHYYLFVGSNPEDIFGVKIYKEMWRKQGKVWTPDSLLEIETPYLGRLPDRYHKLPDQKVESFLVDIYVPPDLQPGRVKFEPQLNIDGHWALYPMEMRISAVVAPPHSVSPAALPSARLSSDSSVFGPLRQYLCGTLERRHKGTEGIRRIIRRNVVEDLAIAREREAEAGKEAVAAQLLQGLEMDTETFCASKTIESESGPEWYLRGRDFLYRGSLDEY